MSIAETMDWVRAWMADPLRVGAVVPSSRALARLITSEISAASAPIIELGAGTGSFTKAMLERGVDERRLVLIEGEADFAHLLNLRFPKARTLSMDAARLKAVELFGFNAAGAVVSGLPLLSMPPKKVIAILEGAFLHLRADGAFYQFTYGPRCPVSRAVLERLGLKATRIGRTVANLPPAAVYRIRRRPARKTAAFSATSQSFLQV